MAADNETFTLESVVRGHHVYKRIWSPRTGQVLEASAETGNPEDRHAVALQQTGEGVTLGHMPREVSKVSWFFLRHGGCISCEITGRKEEVCSFRKMS